MAAYEAGDLPRAAAFLAVLTDEAPDWAEPAFLACLIDLRRGTAEAGLTLATLLERFPDHAPGWERIGRFLLAADKAEAALLCFRRVEAQGGTAAASLLIGSALRKLGRLDAAKAAFAEAVARDPNCIRARFLDALCSQDVEDWTSAAEGYRQVLARDPHVAEASVNLGIVQQAMGDLDGAKQAYGAALRSRPDSFGRIGQALTMASRGELWLDLGRLRRHLVG